MRSSAAFLLGLVLVACGGGDEAVEGASPEAAGTSGSDAPHSHPPFQYEEAVASLDAIESPVIPDWEAEVRRLLLETYDDDGSGELDTDREVDDVPCEVWRAVDQGYRDRAAGDESMRDAYGFAPDTLYIDALGIHRSQRERLRVQLVDCGVR